jgi:predicted peptidase
MRKELLSVLGDFLATGLSARKNDKQGNIISRTTQIASDNYGYQVYIPPKSESDGKIPVIVFLHGIRERGSGGFVPAEGTTGMLIRHYLRQVPSIILLPQCRMGSYWSDPVMDQMVMQALEQTIVEFNGDRKRLYLIGVSMGGYGVWHFASEHPEKFAALVSICGGSPLMTGERFSPIAQKVGRTPSWIFHGSDDRVVPVSESRELVKSIEANQGNVKYTEYETTGHNVWLNVLAEKDLLPWVFAQRLQ